MTTTRAATETFHAAIDRLINWRDTPAPQSAEEAALAAATAEDTLGLVILPSPRAIDAQLALFRRALEILDTSHGHAVTAVERELALATALLGDSA